MKAIKKYNVNNLTNAEWLEIRKEGIGGSDTATILGLNSYKSAYELWLEKTGQIESSDLSDNEAVHFGNVLEDVVAAEFSKRTGLKVQRNNFVLAHPEHDYLRANIDREIVGSPVILECKTTSLFNADKWENEKVPANYIIQVQHYMAVMGYEAAYVAVLIGGQKFKYVEIERHDAIIAEIITQAGKFYNHNVLGNNAPAIDGSSAAGEFLNKQYLNSTATEIALSSEYADELQRYFNIKEKQKRLNEDERLIKNKLKLEMKEAESAKVANYGVRWTPTVSNRVDVKKLKTAYPDIHKELSYQTESRRMSIKEDKGGA